MPVQLRRYDLPDRNAEVYALSVGERGQVFMTREEVAALVATAQSLLWDVPVDPHSPLAGGLGIPSCVGSSRGG